MKHLKKFEELNKDTYLSAANKLRAKGHENRAENLEDHAKKIIVSDDELTYYKTIRNAGSNLSIKVTNPKFITGKITDIEVSREPHKTYSKPDRSVKDRILGKNKNDVATLQYYNLFLDITFSNGDFFKIPFGVEHLQEFFGGGYPTLMFETRRDAVKFVKLCNDKINEYTKKSNFYRPMDTNILRANDFYKE